MDEKPGMSHIPAKHVALWFLLGGIMWLIIGISAYAVWTIF